jgi:hypothetical protein
MNALGHQRLDRVLDPILPAAVPETGCNLPPKADTAISLAQKKRACIGGDCAAVERRCDFPPSETGEIERILATLRLLAFQSEQRILQQEALSLSMDRMAAAANPGW